MERANDDIFECAPFFSVAMTRSYGTNETEVPLKRNNSDSVSVDMPGVTLQWGNLCVYTATYQSSCFNFRRHTASQETILDNVSGVAHPGSLVAIVGPSHLSNTTLLKALALKLSPSTTSVSGKVALNGHVLQKHHLQQMAGYVAANNPFYTAITVREHIWFTAKLKLDSRFTDEQIQQRINGIVNQTGLRFRDKELIGNLSIGDQKRLAIATEMVGDPPLLFCDEPIFEQEDQHEAQKLIGILENLTARGKTVVCVLKQPSSYVFSMFSDMCLLTSHGQVAFNGPIREASHFFESLGYHCPPYFNPANFYLQKVNVKVNSNDSLKFICDKFHSSRYSLHLNNSITSSARRLKELSLDSYIKYNAARYKTTWLTQFTLLLKRFTLSTLRQRRLATTRIAQKLLIVIMASLVFWQVDVASPLNLTGISLLLFIGNVHPTFTTVIHNLPMEISCLLHENQDELYGIETFYLAKYLATVPERVIESMMSVSVAYWITGLNSGATNFFIAALVITLLADTASTLASLIATLFEELKTSAAILISLDCLMLAVGGMFSEFSPSIRWLRYFSWYSYADEVMRNIHWKTAVIKTHSNTSHVLDVNSTLNSEPSNLSVQDFKDEILGINFLALSLICIGIQAASYIAMFTKTKYIERKYRQNIFKCF